MIRSRALAMALVGASAAMASAQDAAEPFPHVRIDPDARVVEFDGRVPILVDDPDAPVVYIELIVCARDSKEHEALVVTDARPRDIHAALLAIGLEPGAPGRFLWNDETETFRAEGATGPELEIAFLYERPSGEQVVNAPREWVRHLDTGERLPKRRWLFAGSRVIDRQSVGGPVNMYDADGTGVIIGLTTFGSEVVAWSETLSPDSGVDDPVWIADPETVPPVDTPVTVRIRPVSDDD